MYSTTNSIVSLPLQLDVSLSYVVIELFCLFGNTLVIFAICNSCRLKTNYYLLVFHVAVCDIVLVLSGNMLFCIPLVDQNISVETFNTLVKIGAISWYPFTTYIFVCECSFLVIIAVQRYKAVTKPLQPKLSRKRLHYIVSGVYIIPLLLHVLNTYCSSRWNQNKYFEIFQWIWELVVTMFPLILIVVLYTKMCRSLLRHNKRTKELFHSGVSNSNQTIATLLKRNYRTIITSMVVVVQFFATVLPARVIHLLMHRIRTIPVAGYHVYWAMMLYMLGSCGLNPIIYGLLDKTLRAAYVKCFKKLLNCLRNRS